MSTIPSTPSPVHGVLGTYELTTLIARNSSLKDVSSLARTCCGMFDALVPLLWEHVKGVDQLFSLLSNTEVKIWQRGGKKNDGSGSLSIRFPITFSDQDLVRFRFYAPFVRRMDIYNSELYKEYAIKNWKTIYDYSRQNELLPNLRSLVLTQSCWMSNHSYYESRLPWLLLFTTPSLAGFETRVDNVQNPSIFSGYGASHLLRNLARSSPDLKTLSLFPTLRRAPFYQDHMFVTQLGEEEDDEDDQPEWFRRLSELKNLRSVYITLPIPLQAGLDVLGRLPRLECLDLMLLPEHFDMDEPSLTLGPDAFPRLRRLTLTRLPDLNLFRGLWNLNALSADLEAVAIRFDKYRWSSLMSYQELSEMVSLICKRSPSVSDLTIYPPYDGTESETSKILERLLSSLPLTRLRICPTEPMPLAMSGTAIYRNLRSLELDTFRTRLIDLSSIARRFPNLDYLAVKLTVTPPELAKMRAQATTDQNPRPIDISISSDECGRSSENRHELESVLSQIWPNACFLRDAVRSDSRVAN